MIQKNTSRSLFLVLLAIVLQNCTFNSKSGQQLELDLETGLNNILRGTDEQMIEEILGEADYIEREWEATENLKYYNYYKKGIQISSQHGKVQCVFIYYRSKRFNKFKGQNKVADEDVTIEMIEARFGKPDYFYQRVNKKYTEFPGKEETFMAYESARISFTFWNKKLGDIRLTKSL